MEGAVSKSEFAQIMGVRDPGRVSQWLAAGQIDGAAVIGAGRTALIDVELARRQLDSRLDLGQRLGANGRARLGVASSPLEDGIKSARLRQLTLCQRARRRGGPCVDQRPMRYRTA